MSNTYGQQKEDKARDYFEKKKTETKSTSNKEYCLICKKVLYQNEKITIDSFAGKIFHTTCFKCKYCKCTLNQGNWGQLGEDFYCKTHTVELFKKGGGKYEVQGTPSKQEELLNKVDKEGDHPEEKVINSPRIGYEVHVKSDENMMEKYMIKEEEKPTKSDHVSTPTSYQEKIVSQVESQDPVSPRGHLKGYVKQSPSGSQKETCFVCSKTVYVNERVSVDGKIFHQDCFRCKYCKCKLNSSNMSQIKSEFYCKTHVLELFKKAGKYDVGSSTEKQEELATLNKTSVPRRNDYTKEDLETIEKMEEYVKKGIIEEFEFNNKLEKMNESYEKKALEGNQINTVVVKSVHSSPQVKQEKYVEKGVEKAGNSASLYSTQDQEAIDKLEELYKMGILTNDERNAKVNQITEKYKKSTSKSSQMSDEDVQVLEKLKKLLDMGVLTHEEYQAKVKQIKDKY